MNKKKITEKEANNARDQHSEFLREAGAHAITVDQIEQDGNKTYAVIALLEKKLNSLPKELEIKSGDNIIKVPLVVKKAPKFKLE